MTPPKPTRKRRSPDGIPDMKCHKQPNGRHRAYIWLDRRKVYVGLWGTPEAKARRDQVVAEWLSAGHTAPSPAPSAPVRGQPQPEAPRGLTLGELCDRWEAEADRRYRRRDGTPTREVYNIRQALRPLREAIPGSLAATFDVGTLDEMRDLHLARKSEKTGKPALARQTVNQHIDRIRRMFKWAERKRMGVTKGTHADLMTLERLKPNRAGPDRERDMKLPSVSWEDVEKTLFQLKEPIRSMVLLQWYTGMRCGEAREMHESDIDRSGDPWHFRPEHHKNEWRGKKRDIPLVDEARVIVEHHIRTKSRKGYLFPSPRNNGLPWHRNSYRRVIVNLCKKLGIETWNPIQLRKALGSRAEEQFGAEVAAEMLGHGNAAVTRASYIDKKRKQLEDAFRKIGP